jgi:hypothetical protein
MKQAAIVGLIVVLALPVIAESDTCSIEGRVLDIVRGTPIAGASVTTVPPTQAVTTDDRGHYVLPRVDRGAYFVVARRPGCVPASVQVHVDRTAAIADLMLEGSCASPQGAGASGKAPRPAALPDTGKKGMTWAKATHDDRLGIDLVSCYGHPLVGGSPGGSPCNAYDGDTSCSESLPILCIKLDGSLRPPYAITSPGHAMSAEFYRGWAGGHIQLTAPIQGLELTSLDTANAMCRAAFGDGYRMAEFHDSRWVPGMGSDRYFGDTWPVEHLRGGGWHWYAYGDIRDDTRFWVSINDQTSNCWDRADAESQGGRSPGK